MRAGQLNRLISIEKQQRTADGQGGATLVWALYAQTWARFEPFGKRDTEEVLAERPQASLYHMITARYVAGVTAAMRVTYQGKAYNIRGIRNLGEQNRTMQLEIEEGVAI